MHTIVVGAGWAGLSCAYTLTKAGQRVTLIEAAPQVGGRARTIKFNEYEVDNGQHICLGAYHLTLGLAAELGLNQRDLFRRLPLSLHMYGPNPLRLNVGHLMAPYNLLWGILTAKHITWRDKLHVINFCHKINRNGGQLAQDCTVEKLLKHYRQPQSLIESLWLPLSLAAMTTPIEHASAQVFINTLRHSFLYDQHDSNWLLPRKDLSQLLPNHIVTYLQQRNCQIITGTAIRKINLGSDQLPTAYSTDQSWQADNIVIATPPWQAKNLLPLPGLENFTYEPITTAYFMCTAPINLPYPMLGFNGGLCQWIFDRAFANQPNILSVIISGPGQHMAMDKQRLSALILDEINTLLPNKVQAIDNLIVKEKRAAFTCDVSIQPHRPAARTAYKNIWLAGDYLQTGLPATLEGAVSSGIKTGKEVLKYIASL